MAQSTVLDVEIKKFNDNAEMWWQEKNSAFRMLHRMNPIRVEYILKQTEKLSTADVPSNAALIGIKILDVGCGGGILSEPLARLGAKVTGIDAGSANIRIAQEHAKNEGLEIEYVYSSIEEFNVPRGTFDVVLAMDIVEHVGNRGLFLQSCAEKLKSGGILIISTINNTLAAKIFVKYIAEDVLRIVPHGTHDADMFVSPQELEKDLQGGATLKDLQGVAYNPITMKFSFCESAMMNYFVTFVKI